MKLAFRQMCCFFLIASLLLQTAPLAQAQPCQDQGSWSRVNVELMEARRILSEDNGPKALQAANVPLDKAKRLANEQSKAFPAQASDLQRGIEKAKVELLWNNRNEALTIVNRLLGSTVACSGKPPIPQPKPQPQPEKDHASGIGAIFGGTIAVAIITVVAGFFLGWGQVSHR